MIDKYTITVDGKCLYRLNEGLAIRQKVTDEELKRLVVLHELKLFVFSHMTKNDDPDFLRECADIVTQIEFALQRNWHFPEDENFHEWYLVPGCACPKMDNADCRGTTMRYINMSCPIHGEA